MIMERKIGEIFEFNGKWYQCIGNPYNECTDCDFCFETGRACVRKVVGQCSMSNRSDGLSVAFKKLEKVGEPYSDYCPSGRVIYFQKYKCYQKPIYTGDIVYWADDIHISLEIKQTKEDMEEKKLNLKPFDIQKAREGKPVCTRDGRKARIICFDGKGDQPIIALVEAKGNKDVLIEKVERYFINGHSVFEVRETNNDLMMLPEKKEGWVNVYKRENEYICENECNVSTGIAVYKSEGEAKRNIDKNEIYVNTIKINWSE